MKMLLIFLVPLMGWAAGTYTATTCNQSDVDAQVNGPLHTAIDGDVINIPAGTCTWTTGVVVPTGIGISIIGAGPSTIIIDNATTSPKRALFGFTPAFGASLSRVSSMTLTIPAGLAAYAVFSPITFAGTCNNGCPNARVDNIVFPDPPGWNGRASPSGALITTNDVFGVLDHNTVINASPGLSGNLKLVSFNNSRWLQGTGGWGDNSWAAPSNYGTAQALYVEDNIATQTNNQPLFNVTESEGGPTSGLAGLADSGGGRIVCRFNEFHGLRSPCSNHGTESCGRSRCARTMEYYYNTLDCLDPSYIGCYTTGGLLNGSTVRGGALISVANTFLLSPTTGINQFAGISLYRMYQNFPPWGPCDGTSLWDLNDPTIYYEGMVASVTGTGGLGSAFVITTADTPNWMVNVWGSAQNSGQPYSFHCDVCTANGNAPTGMEIQTNTANTLTARVWTNNSVVIPVGATFQIRRAFQCLDQSGREQGSPLTLNPATPTNATPGFMYQIPDPVYEAADVATRGGSHPNPSFGFVNANTTRIIANRDYYAEVSQLAQTSPTSPFNGTVGTGYGTLANRPTTCTAGTNGAPGVAYWATDVGNWNTSGSGQQGVLYVCNPTDTWSVYFTPYTYPHPLVTPATPTAPSIISTSPLPAGTVNAVYSYPFQGAGTTPITWSADTTPAGLTFSSAGVLSGTPTTAGTSTINVTATNSVGSTAATPFSIIINPAGTPPTITSPSTLPSAAVNAAYSYQFQANGSTPITWATTSTLPTGFTLSSAGLLSGTPNIAGTSTINVSAMNSAGTAGPTAFTLTINSASRVNYTGIIAH